MKYSISNIAKVITEDPDVLTELDASLNGPVQDLGDDNGMEKPLTSAEIEKQATDVAGEDPNQQVKDQIKAQEEAEQAQEQERRKLLEPQMQELQSSMGELGTGITQGIDAVETGGDAFQGLGDNMTAIQAILKNLEQQVY
jgi:hypothetical protein